MNVREILQELKGQKDLLAEVGKLAFPAKDPPWWERTGLTSGITAVLLVLITSFAGYCQQARLKATEEELIVGREHRSFARDVALRASTALAAIQKVNEERILLLRGTLDALESQQREEIVRRTNTSQATWRQQRYELEAELDLSFDPSGGVAMQFATVRIGMDSLIDCIERVYEGSQGKTYTGAVCPAENSAVNIALAKFQRTVRDAVRNLP